MTGQTILINSGYITKKKQTGVTLSALGVIRLHQLGHAGDQCSTVPPSDRHILNFY
jgi:hypothetical protein